MKKLTMILAIVAAVLLLTAVVEATGAGISAKVFEPLPSYRLGDVITFEFGGVACDPEGADNIATFTATMPDGSVDVRQVLILNGESYIFYIDYIVRAEDILIYEGLSYVRARLSMEGYDTLGGGYGFYASASAAIDLQEEIPVLKVKKANPHRNSKAYK